MAFLEEVDRVIVKIKAVLKKIYLSQWFIIAIIAMGCTLRIRQYLANRSLWLDEACLALNLIRYNYIDLLKPLDFNQAAPPLFLLITNFFTEIFGYSEYVLRFLPFITGIASLFLFWFLARKFLNKFFVPIAVGLLAFSRYAIYYSNEFKQYSVDLMVTIIILIIGLYVYKKGFNITSSLLFGFLGAFLVWLSHTSIFILAGVSLALMLLLVLEGSIKIKKMINVVWMVLIWCISFAMNFIIFVKPTAHQVFYKYCQGDFAPLVTSVNDLLWYPKTIFGIIKNPLYIYFPGIVLLLVLIGFTGLIWKKEKVLLFFITLPLLLLFGASFFKIYPITTRLILFTLPIFYLLINEYIDIGYPI